MIILLIMMQGPIVEEVFIFQGSLINKDIIWGISSDGRALA